MTYRSLPLDLSQFNLKTHFPQPLHHFGWATLSLIFLGYSWLAGTFENFVYWPGAYFMSLWGLSLLIPLIQPSTPGLFSSSQVLKNIIFSLLFGGLHFLTEGFLILILERFFQLEEHYSLQSLMVYFKSNWYEAFQGIVWFWLYWFALQWQKLRSIYLSEKSISGQKSRALGSTQLAKLALQLNPHFLFNTMNNIAMLVRRKENRKAISMITSLNDLLREILYGDLTQKWSFKKELTLIDKYIALEQVRFDEEIEIEREFEECTLDAHLPKLLLHPIIENAFKHGFHPDAGDQKLILKSSLKSDALFLLVQNIGKSSNIPESFQVGGIGLSNTLSRLRHFYKDKFSFQTEELNNGMKITMKLPYESDQVHNSR